MVRKLICMALALFLLAGTFCVDAHAASSEVIAFEDGSYAVISTQTSPARLENNVSGQKTYAYYNSDDVIQWKAVLRGSYVFTGGSYTCTSATCDVTVYANGWYVVSKSTNYAGNRATANLTMGKKVLGVTTATPSCTINLYCDVNGNFS